jgi:hypothetical protein
MRRLKSPPNWPRLAKIKNLPEARSLREVSFFDRLISDFCLTDYVQLPIGCRQTLCARSRNHHIIFDTHAA